MSAPPTPPLVLVIGGHDPSGAGLQADIETLAALGCHAATAVTALTVQATGGARGMTPVAPALLREQVAALLADFRPFAACKVGLVPTAELVETVAELLTALPAPAASAGGGSCVGRNRGSHGREEAADGPPAASRQARAARPAAAPPAVAGASRATPAARLPVVIDPVLGAGAGGALATDDARAALRACLLPLATVATPNVGEARRLIGSVEPDALGAALSADPARHALLTGADEPTAAVTHRLYRDGVLFAEYRWPRLPHHYHGSGCTLASALAAFLARGATPTVAAARAQAYTMATLAAAHSVGGAQLIPGRLRAGAAP